MCKKKGGVLMNIHYNALYKSRRLETIYLYPFPKQALVFTCLQYKSSENTVGKGKEKLASFQPLWRAF